MIRFFACRGVLPLLLAACLAGQPDLCRAEETIDGLPPWPADPADELRRPGVSTFSKGALSNIVIRGYQRENIMVLFDGAPFFGAAPVRIDAPPFHFNHADIAGITVTKGPYNLACPGGAGGTVEVTGPPNLAGLTGRTSLTYGSSDAVSGAAFLSAAGSRADIGAGYAYRTAHVPESGDGRLITAVNYPNPNNNYRLDERDRTMFRNQTAWMRGGFSPGGQSRLDLSYTYQEGEDLLTPTLGYDAPYEQAHRLTARFTLRQPSPLVSEFSLQGWLGRAGIVIDDGLRESSNPDNGSLPLPYRRSLSRSYSTRLDLTADTSGGRAEVRLAAADITLRSGIDFYQRDWDGDYSWLANNNGWRYLDDQTLMPDTTTRNAGAFAILEAPLTSSLRLVAALRGDLARITADGITAALEDFYRAYHGNRPIPHERDFSSLGVNAQLLYSPAPGVELFLKGGRSSRLPDTHELFLTQVRQGSNLVGSPFLDPPVVTEADAGIRVGHDRAGMELTLFYSDVQDYILPGYIFSANLNKAARTAVNVDADIMGVEAEGYVVPIRGLRLGGGLSYGRGENRTTGHPLAEMQPLRGSVSLRYDGGHYFVAVTENMAARQERIDPLLKETETGGFAVTNLSLGYRFRSFALTAGVNNLFDKQYYLPLAYMRDPVNMSVRIPETGRNWYLTASCRF
jgi:iron complex outermembrane receptor protein